MSAGGGAATSAGLAAAICRHCLAVAPGESILLLGPVSLRRLFTALAAAIAAAGGRARLRLWRAGEAFRVPPAPAPGCLDLDGEGVSVDKVVLAVPASLQAGDERRLRQWPGRGIRYVRLEYPDPTDPGAVAACGRALAVDYRALRRRNARLAARLSGREWTITDALGTRLTACIADRPIWREDCRFGPAEPWFQLPGGEVFVAPVEESVHGTFCFPLDWHGLPGAGVARVGVEGGHLVSVAVPRRPALAPLLAARLGVGRERVGEIGFGTNPAATGDGWGAWGEKALGTAHIGIGDNTHLGGRHHSPRHLDIILAAPTVTIGGVRVLRDGRG